MNEDRSKVIFKYAMDFHPQPHLVYKDNFV